MSKKNSIVAELIEKNKGEGFILKDEIIMSLEEFHLSPKQMNKIYDKFEKAGIRVMEADNNCLSDKEVNSIEDVYRDNNDLSGLDGVSAYLRSITKYPVLSAEEERFYAKIIATSDNPNEVAAAKNIMIESNLKFVVSVARHYKMKLPFLDLIQEGNIGLMRAVDKYDYRKNFRFSTYAAYWVRQAIRKAIDESGIIRMPIHIAECYRKINLAQNTLLIRNNGRKPTTEEIAKEAKIPLEKVKELMSRNYSPASLDAALNQESSDDDYSLIDLVSDEQNPVEDMLIHLNLSKEVNELLECLKEKEKLVIVLRLGLHNEDPKTLEEVGNDLGLTRERVRQIEKQTLIKLRNNPRAQDLRNYLL